MKDNIAPYILRHKKLLKKKAEDAVVNRVQRVRSGIFTIPEFDSWQLVNPINVENIEVEGHQNRAMVINSLTMSAKSKVVSLQKSKMNHEELDEIYHQISLHNHDVLLYRSDLVAMSFDLFYLAGGIDELIESLDDALNDLVLRCDLLGATVIESDLSVSEINSTARRNIDKGRLIVNQGSELFG